MARMLGAEWLGEHGSGSGLMTRWDILCVHTIVGFAPAHAAHLSTKANGHISQSRDTKYRSAANLNGNHRVIAVENEDHGEDFDAWNTSDGHAVPGFTSEQCEALARIIVWAYQTHGVPIQLCPNSKPGSRGVAYHRQGVDGNFAGFAYGGRVADGELWSSSRGKVCPGDRRITQLIDVIIPRALVLAGLKKDEDMAITDAEFSRIAVQTKDQVWGSPTPDPLTGNTPKASELLAWARVDALAAHIKAVEALAAVQVVTATVEASVSTAVRDYLTANPPTLQLDYAALAKAVNDDADARNRDGNPATGSTS